MAKQTTKRDSKYYEQKSKALKAKEDKQRQIREAKETLARLRGKKK